MLKREDKAKRLQTMYPVDAETAERLQGMGIDIAADQQLNYYEDLEVRFLLFHSSATALHRLELQELLQARRAASNG